MNIVLEGEKFFIQENEFLEYKHPEYTTLKLFPDLGVLERELGLILEIMQSLNVETYYNYKLSHGGFLPIKVAKECPNDVYVIENDFTQINNLSKNCEIHNINNIKIVDDINVIRTDNRVKLIKDNSREYNQMGQSLNLENNYILLSSQEFNIKNCHVFNLSESNLKIYVSANLLDKFRNEFRYYLEGNNLNFDNLINLCIMVKNAGPKFRKVLEGNLPFIDRWTILDTGSTDGTIEIIKDVLKNKKGQLYQEPFINFRDSRNRCLDLAGTRCKYTIMLDDTYVLTGNVRNFLTLLRSDQFGESYDIFIKSDDVTYGSNRLLKSRAKLRYKYKIHEIVDCKDSIQIPQNEILVIDYVDDYMIKRTKDRKLYDLELLNDTLIEYPNVSRTYFYIARTYLDLENFEKAFEFYLKRCNHPDEGFKEEISESYFMCGLLGEQKLGLGWEECEYFYKKSIEYCPGKVEAYYCMAFKYNNSGRKQEAFEIMKKILYMNYPNGQTSNLRFNVYDTQVPRDLTHLSYYMKDYKTGFDASSRFLLKNQDATILSFHRIFSKFSNFDNGIMKQNLENCLCIVADGGFKEWSGSSIYKDGIGGSETFIIELSKNLAYLTDLDIIVFCNTDKEEVFDNVTYRKIDKYVDFICKFQIKNCIISRYSEYLPVTVEAGVENIIFVMHDTFPSCNIIPLDHNISKVLCMSEWHSKLFIKSYPSLEKRVEVFPNSINVKKFSLTKNKIKNSFIYSSMANRGLIHLLKMFPEIRKKMPDATLKIFCDMENDYIKSLIPEDLNIIKKLIEEQKDYIKNLGWVDKNTLIDHFLESEYWLYPCTFEETFCISAIEAKAAGVIPICNDLGALPEIVNDGGIIIPGDVSKKEWQDLAIEQIIELSNNDHKRNYLIAKNKEWVKAFDWKNVSMRFKEKYL